MKQRICLTLAAPSLAEDLALARKYGALADFLELRADRLAAPDPGAIADFPAQAGIPAILTFRRTRDGGAFDGEDASREPLFAAALPAFDFVDFESDFAVPGLEALARRSGTRIIRSVHDFRGYDGAIAASIDSILRSEDEIPKLAFKANSPADIAAFHRAVAGLPGRDRIFCAMGPAGAVTRILPAAFGSMLTFASPPESVASMGAIGHIDIVSLSRIHQVRKTGPGTSLRAVTGWPLAVTSSPEIHRAYCDGDGTDAVMVPIPSREIGPAIGLCEELGFRGLAVTVPHKQSLLALLDDVSPDAKAVGAANTVVWENGRRIGHNTDIAGFSDAISAFAGRERLDGARTAVIGSGGAARAVAYALSRLGADGSIYARNAAAAAGLSALSGFRALPIGAIAGNGPFDLIVQCTSLGNGSSNPADDPIPEYRFSGHELVYDLIYKPARTPLLRRASAAGCRVENGMSMLIAQGRRQHRLWNA